MEIWIQVTFGGQIFMSFEPFVLKRLLAYLDSLEEVRHR